MDPRVQLGKSSTLFGRFVKHKIKFKTPDSTENDPTPISSFGSSLELDSVLPWKGGLIRKIILQTSRGS